uniref:Uncharacterized protein n=1 Tax=Oryza sativa subsp. japonica TaxID=39947 RepID=Q33AT8_ORYSJ|nr:hypothetical protein LOC_Os10g08269 [Oryza sativa Japonica Group]
MAALPGGGSRGWSRCRF